MLEQRVGYVKVYIYMSFEFDGCQFPIPVESVDQMTRLRLFLLIQDMGEYFRRHLYMILYESLSVPSTSKIQLGNNAVCSLVKGLLIAI